MCLHNFSMFSCEDCKQFQHIYLCHSKQWSISFIFWRNIKTVSNSSKIFCHAERASFNGHLMRERWLGHRERPLCFAKSVRLNFVWNNTWKRKFVLITSKYKDLQKWVILNIFSWISEIEDEDEINSEAGCFKLDQWLLLTWLRVAEIDNRRQYNRISDHIFKVDGVTCDIPNSPLFEDSSPVAQFTFNMFSRVKIRRNKSSPILHFPHDQSSDHNMQVY